MPPLLNWNQNDSTTRFETSSEAGGEHQHRLLEIKIISLTVLSEDWCSVDYQEMRAPQDCLEIGNEGAFGLQCVYKRPPSSPKQKG